MKNALSKFVFLLALLIIAGCSEERVDGRSKGVNAKLQSGFAVEGDGSESELDKIRREMRAADAFLQDELDAEKKTRAAEDANIRQDISDLRAVTDSLALLLRDEIKKINKTLAEQKKAIVEQATAFGDSLKLFRDSVAVDIAALQETDDNIFGHIAGLSAANSANAKALKELGERFDTYVAEATEKQAELSSKLSALGSELNSKLSNQASTLERKIATLDQAMVAQGLANANQLADLRTTLSAELDSLEVRIDAKIAAGDAAQAADLKETRKTLQIQVADLGVQISNTTGQVNAITTSLGHMQSQLLGLNERLTSELAGTEAELRAAIAAQDLAAQGRLTEAKTELLVKIAANSQRIDEAADSTNAALVQQRLDLQKQLTTTKRDLINATALQSGKLQAELLKLAEALAASDAEIRSLLSAMDATLLDRIPLVSSQISSLPDAKLPQIRGQIETAMAGITEIIAAMQSQSENVDSRITAQLLEATKVIHQNTKDEIAISAAMLQGEIGQVASDLSAYKIQASQTFATKAQLDVVNASVTTLSNLVNTLGSKIDLNDTELRAKISAVDAKADEFINNISRDLGDITARVGDLEGKFAAHLQAYEQMTKRLADQASENLSHLTAMIQSVDATNMAALDEFDQRLSAAEDQVLTFEGAMQEAREEFGRKMGELETRAKESSDAAIKAAVAKSKSELMNVITVEQNERKKLTDQVTVLTGQMQTVKANADQALKLATANEMALHELKVVQAQHSAAIDQIRKDMKTQYDDLKSYANQVTANLGAQTERKFQQLVVDLAELSNRTNAERDSICSSLKNLITATDSFGQSAADNFSVNYCNQAMKPLLDNLVQSTIELTAVMNIIQSEMLFVMDSATGKTFDSTLIFEDFKTQVAQRKECGGTAGVDKSKLAPFQVEVGGVTADFHLLHTYQKALMQGPRTENLEFDRIYFGYLPQVTGNSLAGLVYQAVLPPYAQAESGECVVIANAWGNRILTEQGIAINATNKAFLDKLKELRNKLVTDARLKSSVTTMLKSVFDKMITSGQAVEDMAIQKVKDAIGLKQAQLLVSTGTDKLTSGRAIIASVVQKVAEGVISERQKRSDMGTVIDIAKEFAKVSDQATKTNERVAAVEASIAALNSKMDQMSKKVDDGLSASLGLIYAMASRLGFKDIADAATTISAELGIPKWDHRLEFQTQCIATSRFYNFLANTALLEECSSSLNWKSNGSFGEDPERCRAYNEKTTTSTGTNTIVNYTYQYVNRVIYGRWQFNYYGRPWYTIFYDEITFRTFEVANYWSNPRYETKEKLVGAQINGLTVPILAPALPRAKELLSRLVGTRPPDKETMIGLRIYGYGQFIKLTDPLNPSRTVTLLAKDFVAPSNKFIQEADRGMVYHIPVSFFLATGAGSLGTTNEVKVQFLNHANVAQGSECISRAASTKLVNLPTVYQTVVQNYPITVYSETYRPSPIVLDLDGDGVVKTIDPFYSKADFDIDANDSIDRIGWIQPSEGLLALDQNQNGRIDDGRELFGNYTARENGRKAEWENGYKALEQYDQNRDGMIDSKDSVFSKLLVWRDLDGDGRSTKSELTKLSEMEITGISVKATEVFGAKRHQSVREDSPGNTLAYESRFFGPKQCGEAGCVSYDVLFGRDSSLWISTAGK